MARVLVAEHEETFSDVLSYQLRRQGFVVAVCATGPEVLAAFDRHGADLVLHNPMLPVFRGPGCACVCANGRTCR